MANIESNTLLEKLTQINNVKNRLRQTIVNIGGGDYISEKSPFAAFPRAISRVHSDINNVSKLLEYIDLGGDLEEIVNKENTMYKDTIPYINHILDSKQALVNNLRLRGVYAEVNEPFDMLVEKVLRIQGESPTPSGEIYSKIVSNNEYTIRYTVEAIGRNNEGYYVLKYTVYNICDNNINGIMVKDIDVNTGNDHLIGTPFTIPAHESYYLTFWYLEEDYNRFIERYSGNIITQFDTFDYCDYYNFTLYGDRIGYDDLTCQVNIYSSSYLAAKLSTHSYHSSGETYVVSDGIAVLGIDTINETTRVFNVFESGATIYTNGGLNWGATFGEFNSNMDLFLSTFIDFNWDASYSHMLDLYNAYHSESEWYIIDAIVGESVETSVFRFEVTEFTNTYIKTDMTNKTNDYFEYDVQHEYASEDGPIMTFAVQPNRTESNTHYYSGDWYRPVRIKVRINS